MTEPEQSRVRRFVWTSAALLLAGASIALGALLLTARSDNDRLRDQLAASATKSSEFLQELATARNDVDATATKLDAAEARITALEARPPLALLVAPPITLSDPQMIEQALNAGCQVSAGANAQPPSQEAFVTYFHDLETQQQKLRNAGQSYNRPDITAQANDYARRPSVCY